MQVIGIVIVALGIGLMVVAGIGLLRFPDIFLRMSAVTKAATMGTSLILLATAFYFGRFDLGSFSRVLAIIFFIFVIIVANIIIINNKSSNNRRITLVCCSQYFSSNEERRTES